MNKNKLFLALLAAAATIPLLNVSNAFASPLALNQAISKMPTDRSYHLQSSTAYMACRNYQSQNTWVGKLINARNIGSGLFGCNFTNACLRVDTWGRQAATFPVTGSQIAKKLETDLTK
jgi:hypothetical protein